MSTKYENMSLICYVENLEEVKKKLRKLMIQLWMIDIINCKKLFLKNTLEVSTKQEVSYLNLLDDFIMHIKILSFLKKLLISEDVFFLDKLEYSGVDCQL